MSLKIGFDVEGRLKTGDKEVRGHGSPTTDVFRHLIGGFCGAPLTRLLEIGRLTLVDNTGAERDYVESASLTYIRESSYVRVYGPVSITSDYIVSRIRAGPTGLAYFDTPLAEPVGVISGTTAVAEIVVSPSLSGSAVFEGVTYSIQDAGVIYQIIRELGFYPVPGFSWTLDRIIVDGSVLALFESRTLSPDGLTCTAEAKVYYGSSTTIRDVLIRSGSLHDFWRYSHPAGATIPANTVFKFRVTARRP